MPGRFDPDTLVLAVDGVQIANLEKLGLDFRSQRLPDRRHRRFSASFGVLSADDPRDLSEFVPVPGKFREYPSRDVDPGLHGGRRMETAVPEVTPHPIVADTEAALRQELPRISKLVVPVSVRLGGLQMTVSDLCQLVPGMVLSFDLSSDNSPQLIANGQTLASGETVRRGSQLGFRLGNLATGVAPRAGLW